MIRLAALACVLLLVEGCASQCEQPSALSRMATRGRKLELLECLEAEESWVREETARALGVVRSQEVADRLEAILLDRSERAWVRAAAADALGRLQNPKSFEAITGALATPGLEPETKLALIAALCTYSARATDAVQSITPLKDDEDLVVAAFAAKKVMTQCAD